MALGPPKRRRLWRKAETLAFFVEEEEAAARQKQKNEILLTEWAGMEKTFKWDSKSQCGCIIPC